MADLTRSELLEKFSAVCGVDNVVTDGGGKYLRDVLGRREGRALAVVKPQTAAQVAAMVNLCAQTKTPLVPQGGNTGYRGGCIPDSSGRMLVVSLEKMRAAPSVNLKAQTMLAPAGCILEDAQNAAAAHGMLFPLNIGAKGTCQIGGNLATNAGGLNFLRYGGARELCVGLEAVLPSGETVNLISGARKNNAGYDLKNLLIGSEGTLGIITAASLKIFPSPPHRAAAFAAAEDVGRAMELLSLCHDSLGTRVESFELMPRLLLQFLKQHFPRTPQPFANIPPLAILIEAADENGDVGEQLQTVLERALEKNIIADAALPGAESQRRQFWELREAAPEATKREGRWMKLDVCLPLERLAEFVAAVEKTHSSERNILAFGHLGDGNLHLSLRPPSEKNMDEKKEAIICSEVLDLAEAMGGSFSAEHGIGRAQTAALKKYRSPAVLAAMRAVKTALDPDNLMNPGALFGD